MSGGGYGGRGSFYGIIIFLWGSIGFEGRRVEFWSQED
jgi:hypothetical protein